MCQGQEGGLETSFVLGCTFYRMSRHGKDQSDLLNRTQTIEAESLKELPVFKNLLKQFTTQEIIAWPLPKETQILSKHPVFKC